jgi:hypothetical protein
MRTLSRVPLHPVLLAAYAVLFVYAANITEILPGDLWWPLLVALAGGSVALAVCALLYRDARRGALLASALVLAFAFFGHLGSQLDEAVIGEVVQLAGWAALIVVVAVLAARLKGSLGSVTAALNVFTLVLVGIALLTIIPAEASRVARASDSEEDPVSPAPSGDVMAKATRTPERDIYFLVFDRYGSDWSIQERFGLENDIYEQLEARGFEVVPGARANYRASDFSIASMLSMETLDDLTESVGRVSDDRTPARERLGDHEVGRFLRANGYHYYHLGSWYGPTRTNPIADESLAWGRTTEF